MSKTIVQEYGPIYGEAVNGTVQGRPNGSIFVPTTNTVSVRFLADSPDPPQVVKWASSERFYIAPKLDAVAVAQDIASNIRFATYTDSDCTTLFAKRDVQAGLFNLTEIEWIGMTEVAQDQGETYYFRVELVNNGSLVTATETIEVKGRYF
jgi:hypothetical protein